MKKMGLKPATESFFQKVNIVGSKIDSSSHIQIDKKNKIIYNSNSFIRLSGGESEVHFSGEELVLLGFGFENVDNFSALNDWFSVNYNQLRMYTYFDLVYNLPIFKKSLLTNNLFKF